jgi:hypothetical protein
LRGIGIDESPALAKVLNFGSESPESQDNPPQRGLVDEAETRPAETTPTRDKTEPDLGTSEQYKDQAEEQEIGDLPDIELSDAGMMMDKVYGDHVHQNPGTHLRGDIPDDERWQDYWRRLIVFPSQTYDAPSGAVGRRLIEMLADMLAGIQAQKMNAERFIVFQIVVLQRSREVKKAKDVRKRLS